MFRPIHLKEAMRIFRRSLSARHNGTRRYSGSAEEICRKIISDCWNEKEGYFRTSTGHFSEFYTRDFAFCIEALLKLGFRKKVRLTLEYALKRFSQSGRIATAISPEGRPFDFPAYASDSLPLLVRSLVRADAGGLIRKHESLIVNEINRYYHVVFDSRTSMVRKNKHFSSIKDWAKRSSSCYDNCMLAMLRNDLEKLGFYNPFHEHDIRKRIKDELWSGKFFYDDMRKKDIVSGDANVFPFWTGVFSKRNMRKSCIRQMQKAKLDRPFPLKYTNTRKGQRFLFSEILVRNYEGTAVWPHLGMCYVDVVRKHSKKEAERYIKRYRKLIEKHRNFLEVFEEDGRPFKRLFYYTDEGMLWAAKYLGLGGQ